MTKTLAGKVALITGGARGIGRATALKLAANGCDIVVNYYNSSDAAESLCQDIRQLGVQAIPVQANVADPAAMSDLQTQFKLYFDHLDIFVSNAASGVLKPAMNMKLKHWRWCLETNAFALVNVLQAMQEFMNNGSRVIALSSSGASHAIPDYSFIGASKAALESLVRALSLELAPEGISLNCVSAGVVDTDALKQFPARDTLLDEGQKKSLVGRNITPEEVADAIYLLCLPEAAMIRGQTLRVDAGYSVIA